jgi:glycine/D-amino acid oxidase-like deaminating enzyme
MGTWQRWEKDQVSRAIRWTGCLCYELSGEALEQQHLTLANLGYESNLLGPNDIRNICPDIPKLPQEALWFSGEGVAETGALTMDLLNAAVGLGAKVTVGLPVTEFLVRSGAVCGVQTIAGPIEADFVVVANGTGAPKLAATFGAHIPLLPRPGVLFWTRRMPRILGPVMVAPEMEFRQLPDGRFMAPTTAGHQGDDTAHLGTLPSEAANGGLERLRAISGIKDLELEAVAVGWRPVPEDGLPVIGFGELPGVYFAVMHSGVTLAAGVAEIVAEELEHGARSDLSAYRPQRFGQM